MITHESRSSAYRRPFGAAAAGAAVTLSAVRAGASEMVLRLHPFAGADRFLPMAPAGEGRFTVTFQAPETPCVLWYSFLAAGEETCQWQLTVYEPASVPQWWKDAVVYQIFPDRFAREADWRPQEPAARRGTHRFLIRDWDTPAFYPRGEDNAVTAWPFWGGTLRGIREKLPYLQSLGVTALYLNPIFEARSSHRYDTGDYMRIDPLLGTESDFVELCQAAQAAGMHIILDGVFNHTGADSRYFDAYGNYGTGDAYRHWFRFGPQYTHGYECWWDVPDQPNVEENDPTYREFICGEDGVLRHWLRLGADGWRLDVADEMPDSFIRDIRAAVKAEKPDALLLGEVWEDASNKVSYGQLREYLLGRELDSTMHYPLRELVLDFLSWRCSAGAACDRLWEIQEHYPPESLYAALNLMGSHDRERLLTVLGGDKQAVKQAFFLQFVLPGVPCVYYGDEAGMTGGADPYNRGPFPWGREDRDLTEHLRAMTGLYRRYPVLRGGGCEPVAWGENVLGCRRWDQHGSVLALVNRSDREETCYGLTVPARGWAIG